MTDTVLPQRRSEIMRNIGPRNTLPEIYIRSQIHRMGFRFRLHVRKLPGTPDIVLPRHGKVILVNGCFWHGHQNCKKAGLPKSNVNFWKKKLTRNQKRDQENIAALVGLKWKVLTVWQCELKNAGQLDRKLKKYLGTP
jgi:DNA mismatch endonuclease (patch repair protein)